jgi:small redox-active disulfide protein 2
MRGDLVRDLKILGTGCPKCQKLREQTEAAAQSLGLEYRVEKVTELQQIMAYGVMQTPALVADGRVLVAGKVPSVDEIAKLLKLITAILGSRPA